MFFIYLINKVSLTLLDTNKEGIKEFRKEDNSNSTKIREAFYIEFVDSIRSKTKVPILLTGNIYL
jgi:hypothetical protein